MNFHILTLFPDMVRDGLHTSILGRAAANGHIQMNVVNIRDYTLDKHKKVDDYPYGGGAGMLMQAQPIYDAYLSVCKKIEKAGMESAEETVKRPRCVYVTPQGGVFNQSMAVDFAKEEDLLILCGHYEGVDERVLEEIVTDYVSIGDYVLTGGELAVEVICDAVIRLIPGVISDETSALSDSFQDNLLAPPVYTRPAEYNGWKVPEVLLSGHEAKIRQWEFEQSLERTKLLRPDLLK